MTCPYCGAENRDDAAFCGSCRATLASGSVATPPPPPTRYDWSTPYVDRSVEGAVTPPGYAGFWARLLAVFLDNICGSIGGGVAAVFGYGMFRLVASNRGSLIFAIVVFLLVAVAYEWIATAVGGGFGKRIVGIRVVRADTGAVPGYGRALGRLVTRYVIGFVPIVGVPAQFLDGLWMLWDGERQTLHDKAAGTHVVRV